MSRENAREPVDLRLVVCDMDGTLLDAEKQIPDSLEPLLERLHERGIVFCPASGRQYATLAAMFPDLPDETVFIAENGAHVVADGRVLSTSPLLMPVVKRIVTAMDDLARREDIGVIVCTTETAYVDRHDEDFRVHVDPHYAEVTEVPSLADLVHGAVSEDDLPVVKVAVFASAGPEGEVLRTLTEQCGDDAEVVVSGPQYVDVMAAGAHKGAAVAALQRSLGVSRAQTAAFGDAPNDAEMLDEADWSFAMANAHDEILARARYRAPANTEDGVAVTVHRLLDGERPDTDSW